MHAIDILDNALQGDPGGISFLEQTVSIYVLDVATSPDQPKTYGWWVSLNIHYMHVHIICAYHVFLNYWHADIIHPINIITYISYHRTF